MIFNCSSGMTGGKLDVALKTIDSKVSFYVPFLCQ